MAAAKTKKKSATKDGGSKHASPEERENVKKWTGVVWSSGWTGIPTVLFERQSVLGLSAQELNVLLQLLKHWWRADSHPYPSRKALGEAIGLSTQSVQRHLTRLARDKFIEVKRRKKPDGGYTSNEYTFKGLVGMLKPLAQEALDARKAREQDEAMRRRRRPARK